MQKPTVGRVLHFFAPAGAEIESDQPMAAIVTYVHSDTMVNVAFFDSFSRGHEATSVDLVPDDEEPTSWPYVRWPQRQPAS